MNLCRSFHQEKPDNILVNDEENFGLDATFLWLYGNLLLWIINVLHGNEIDLLNLQFFLFEASKKFPNFWEFSFYIEKGAKQYYKIDFIFYSFWKARLFADLWHTFHIDIFHCTSFIKEMIFPKGQKTLHFYQTLQF